MQQLEELISSAQFYWLMLMIRTLTVWRAGISSIKSSTIILSSIPKVKTWFFRYSLTNTLFDTPDHSIALPKKFTYSKLTMHSWRNNWRFFTLNQIHGYLNIQNFLISFLVDQLDIFTRCPIPAPSEYPVTSKSKSGFDAKASTRQSFNVCKNISINCKLNRCKRESRLLWI